MGVSIFIRTYEKDIKWLNYCLHSIHKNLSGWDEIVICIPKGQEEQLSHLTAEKVVTCKRYTDDYLGQQISKLHAHKHCQNEFILFVDSDLMFFEKTDVSEYFNEKLPVLLKNKYENVGEAICWKKITEKLFREEIHFEYMRRAPQLYRKDTIEKFNEAFPSIEYYIMDQPLRQFSEFNALGFFIEKNEPYNYKITDLSKEDTPTNKAKQYWSWSGLTKEERIEIETRLS